MTFVLVAAADRRRARRLDRATGLGDPAQQFSAGSTLPRAGLLLLDGGIASFDFAEPLSQKATKRLTKLA